MSSIFGSFGQNNQQQQQQPQQGSAFGQTPSAFGTAPGFTGFGQNQQQQQQQPQVNPMFGSLAVPSSSAPSTGGFGAFGNPQATNAFGARPAFGSTGASPFGQPSTFNANAGGGIFGSGFGSTTAPAASGFGQPSQPQQQQQSAFGTSNSGIFGKSSTGFGTTALAPTSTSPVPSTGTANPPFQEVQERDPTSAGSTSMLRFQSITAMPEYRNASFEELRVQDYLQGRKVASSTSAFGTAPTTSAFGQPSQQPTSLFSQPSTTTSAFGQPQTGTGFGTFGQTQQQQQQPQQSAFGNFGQTPQQQPQQQQQPASTGFGVFGQQTQQQPTSGFGAFGQQNQQQPQQQPTGAFGSFGQQNKGFGTFGAQTTQPNPSPFSGFGSNTSTTGTSAFGQPQQQQPGFGNFGQSSAQQPSAFSKPSIFGTQPNTGVFGNPTGNQQQQPQTSIFGTPSATAQQPAQSGLFGAQTAQQQSAYGQPQQPAQQTSLFSNQPTTGGLFGNTNQNQQQNQQQPAPGGFSSLFSKPAGSSIFGTGATNQQSINPPAQNPNPSNPLFSGGGGLFGNTGSNQPAPSGTGSTLFGAPSTGTANAWGAKPPTSAPAFGSAGGLFGNLNQGSQPTQPGLFGNAAQQPQQQSGGLFGTSTFNNAAQQPPQQSLIASIDQPLPANLPTLPPLAASLTLDKKKSNIFTDIALRTSPRLSLHYKPPSPGPKPRSLNSSSTNRWQIPYSSSTQGTPNKLLPMSESKSLITPEAFASPGSLQLLNGARHSVKKLVLDKRVENNDIARLRPNSSSDSQARFNPALEAMARAMDNESSITATSFMSPAKGGQGSVSSLAAVPPEKAAAAVTNGKVTATPLDPQEGEYWCLPTVPDLQRLSYNELQAVKDFTVGRVGFGTVQFLRPVDLTTVPSIADIPGKIITFDHMECTLYTDERLRPPPGEGLNVPARIKLDRCWALDKSTREPIKDSESLKYQQRLRKMQKQEGTEFVSFDKETGVWEFLVQEF